MKMALCLNWLSDTLNLVKIRFMFQWQEALFLQQVSLNHQHRSHCSLSVSMPLSEPLSLLSSLPSSFKSCRNLSQMSPWIHLTKLFNQRLFWHSMSNARLILKNTHYCFQRPRWHLHICWFVRLTHSKAKHIWFILICIKEKQHIFTLRR